MRVLATTVKTKTDGGSIKVVNITTNINLDKIATPYLSIVKASLAVAQRVWESEEFKEALGNEIFLSNDLEGELSDYKNASVEDIWKQLFDVKNVVGQGYRGKVELDLATYNNSWTSAIGYGLPTDDIIRLNIKYLKKLSPENPISLMDLGSLITHEFSHNRGFDHDFKKTKRRPNSLSYVINRAFESSYIKIFNVPTVKTETKFYIPWYKRLYRAIFK
jgi:hypothetical protein